MKMKEKRNYFEYDWEVGHWFASLTLFERCMVRDFIVKRAPKLFVFEDFDEEEGES